MREAKYEKYESTIFFYKKRMHIELVIGWCGKNKLSRIIYKLQRHFKKEPKKSIFTGRHVRENSHNLDKPYSNFNLILIKFYCFRHCAVE